MNISPQSTSWQEAAHSGSVTANNVAPAVTATSDTIDEGGTATVSGTITDSGTQDSFTVVIDWGDGSNFVFGRTGNSHITTGIGNDHIVRGAGNGDINAGGGNNHVEAGASNYAITTGMATMTSPVATGMGPSGPSTLVEGTTRWWLETLYTPSPQATGTTR